MKLNEKRKKTALFLLKNKVEPTELNKERNKWFIFFLGSCLILLASLFRTDLIVFFYFSLAILFFTAYKAYSWKIIIEDLHYVRGYIKYLIDFIGTTQNDSEKRLAINKFNEFKSWYDDSISISEVNALDKKIAEQNIEIRNYAISFYEDYKQNPHNWDTPESKKMINTIIAFLTKDGYLGQ